MDGAKVGGSGNRTRALWGTGPSPFQPSYFFLQCLTEKHKSLFHVINMKSRIGLECVFTNDILEKPPNVSYTDSSSQRKKKMDGAKVDDTGNRTRVLWWIGPSPLQPSYFFLQIIIEKHKSIFHVINMKSRIGLECVFNEKEKNGWCKSWRLRESNPYRSITFPTQLLLLTDSNRKT
jgi:hypothetical protein